MRILLVCLAGFVLGCGGGLDRSVSGPAVKSAVESAGAPLSPVAARAELDRRGIAYTFTVFWGAAVVGELEVIQLFVWAGAPVNRRIDNWDIRWDDWTVLHVAAHHGHLEIVKFLVEHGADISARTGWRTNGDTPAALAAKAGHFEIVKYLESQRG